MSKNLDQKPSRFDIIDRKISILTRHPKLFLIGIGLIGFFVRMYYFPFEIPIFHDSIDYFSYAVSISQQGHFPIGWDLSNNGWPTFLSIFFSIHSDGGLWELMYIQRMLTVIISVLTIIPIYLLCTRFVPRRYALIGSTLFLMDPRIITNSFLGVTEASFVLLGSLALFLFLSKDFKVVLASFGILALFTLIRYEGIVLIIPFLIFFLIRFRSQRKVILKFLGVITIFILILLPMAYFRMEATGNDGIISMALAGPGYVSKHIIQGVPDVDDAVYGPDTKENRVTQFVTLGFGNLVKYLGWITIPVFIFFVPIGFFIFLRNPNDKTKTILSVSFFLLIPAFYAYGRGIEETRYLYVLFPIFCIFSSFTIMKIGDRVGKKEIITILLICGIFIGSIGFLDYKKIDSEYERESYLIVKDIERIADGLNNYDTGSKYIQISEIENNWPVIFSVSDEFSADQKYEITKVAPWSFSTLFEYIKDSKDKGLTHIVSDGKQNRAVFLNDVFYNEKEFPYLIKEYDSHEQGFQYHVKVYKIDFEKFMELSPKN